jgi:hypothetical protein
MLTLYRWFLYLYPSSYRHEFAEEMVSVFHDAQTEADSAGFAYRTSFQIRETFGLLAGATREHFNIMSGNDRSISFRRFGMRSEFRFPRSTVFLMSVIFAGVLLAMEKANSIQVKYGAANGSIWPSTPWFFARAFLITCAAALAGWGILYALKRTGTDRLANIQSDPDKTR